MYVSLAMDHGHRDVDTHRTVQSYMSWRYPDMEWKAWRPGVNMGDQRSRTLFIEGGRLRSENQYAVNGYASVMVTNDLVLNTNINMFLGCTEKGVHSTLDGDIVRTVLADDEGNRATFDWAINDARSGGYLSDGWVHVAMTLDEQSIGIYVDGTELDSDSIGFQPVANDAEWTELPMSVINDAMRQQWIASDDEVTSDSCRECDNLDGVDNTDPRREFIQYPMYLALDERGADETVASYMAAFYPNVPYVN